MIIINDNYAIDSDELNIILMKRYEKKRDKDENGDLIGEIEYGWRQQGYYPSFESALNSMVRKEIMGNGLEDLRTIIDKLNDIEKTIKKL
ncbi:MAG: hypothetical protein ACRCTZ_13860 [Sarcina sp.]